MSRKSRVTKPFKTSTLSDPDMLARFEAEKQRHLADRRAAGQRLRVDSR